MERCFWSMKNSLQKKQGAVSHFRVMGDQTHFKTKSNKVLSKAYVKTAHAVYESTKLFRHGAISRYSR